MSVQLSQDLRSFLETIISDRLDMLLEAYAKPLPDSFRVNTLKIELEECLKLLQDEGLTVKRIPFTFDGFYAEPEGVLTVSLWHMLGYVYAQGPVSILVTELLDVEPGHMVLDLCAAPGSKTTHIAAKLGGRGVVVANDVSRTRIKALSSNMQRCGVVNGVLTLADGRRFGYKYREMFDRVLVDAPCTSLGIGSKDWSVLRNWTSGSSMRLARLQTSLLFSGYMALKPGGVLIYSTCTLHPLENEAVVNSLLEKFEEAEVLPITLHGLGYDQGFSEWGGRSFSPEMCKTVRIWPFQSGAEGFYIAKIRKPG
ncbi:MAG: RsmB/NOP family class I SAM-dependent RNA methyltransferase [Candidatus Caldarchaeum sp.]